MSQALYRKYRSLKLEDVLGQDHITGILRRALDKGKISHAYLLSGPRGTGKTSVARILAHEINGLPYSKEASHIDIIEIDAASNNGVDDIRNLREKSQIAPVSANYKIYIIDEVHMLSKSAFNALLKTLEEPPEHIVFIMATTDADKLPATILSRVQQYHFHPISEKTIAKHLINIAKKEGFVLTESAAAMIAQRSNGGFRDSISLLDQLSSLADKDTPLDESIISTSLGLPAQQLVDDILNAYDTQDPAKIIDSLKAPEEAGISINALVEQLMKTIRDRLADDTELIHLMVRLANISGHAHPDIRLISALMPARQAAEPKKATVSSPLKTSRSAPTISVKPEPKAEARPKPEEPAKVAEPTPTYKRQKSSNVDASKFDWAGFIENARERSIGLYSLLTKCGYQIDGGSLIIYSGTAFTKKRLEVAKSMQIIASAADSQCDGINIEIRDGTKPPSNDKLAAVANIMGGGEEINLEEIQ